MYESYSALFMSDTYYTDRCVLIERTERGTRRLLDNGCKQHHPGMLAGISQIHTKYLSQWHLLSGANISAKGKQRSYNADSNDLTVSHIQLQLDHHRHTSNNLLPSNRRYLKYQKERKAPLSETLYHLRASTRTRRCFDCLLCE